MKKTSNIVSFTIKPQKLETLKQSARHSWKSYTYMHMYTHPTPSLTYT